MEFGAFALSLLLTAVGFAILWAVIRNAVRSGLEEHYRIVRWYEATGEWHGSKPDPRDLSEASKEPPASW